MRCFELLGIEVMSAHAMAVRPTRDACETQVRRDRLEPRASVTHCPYKGEAEYGSLRGSDGTSDVAWSYRTPLPESHKIAGLTSFYTDKVALYVDGVKQT